MLPSPRPSMSLLLVSLVPGALLAQVEVRPPRIDFGERGMQETPETTIRLENRGMKPATIKEIKKSCDCITVTPASLPAPIPVGGSAVLKVSMGSGRAMGRLDKWLTIVTGDRLRPEIRVPIEMRVLAEFRMEPREIRFEGAVGGRPEKASVEVTRRGPGGAPPRLSVVAIRGRFHRPGDSHLKARVEAIPGGQRIEVTLDPSHPEGPISAELEASLDGKALIIPIGGEMFAWIKVSPNYINFSRAVETEPSSLLRELILSSTDGTPFRILAIEAKPGREGEKAVRLELSSAPVAPAGGSPGEAPTAAAPSAAQKVTCRIARGEGGEGGVSFFGSVTIRTDHPKKPEITLKYSGFFAGKA